MSDMPLDGGSGWPTSAYAVVPRPPANPTSDPTSEAPGEQPAEKPDQKRDGKPSAPGVAVSQPGAAQPAVAPTGPGSPSGVAPATGEAVESRSASGGASANDAPVVPAGPVGADEPSAGQQQGQRAAATQAVTQPGEGRPGDVSSVGDVEPSPDPATGRGPRWALVVGVLLVLLAVALIVTLILRGARSSGDGDASRGSADRAPAAGALTGAPAAARNDPSADSGDEPVQTPADVSPSAVSPAAPVTDVLRSGTVRLTVIAGRPDENFDLDTGVKEAPNSDIAAAAVALNATNGAAFAPWTQPGAPTAAGCAAVPQARWSTSLLLGAVVPGATVCARTSEQRLASFVVRAGEAITDGQLYTTYLEFTVWKKAGD